MRRHRSDVHLTSYTGLSAMMGPHWGVRRDHLTMEMHYPQANLTFHPRTHDTSM